MTGPSAVIDATGAGRRAAKGVERYLQGKRLEYKNPVPAIIAYEDLDMSGVKKRKRQKMSCLAPKKRNKGFHEVGLGYSEMEALAEADRCPQCGMNPLNVFAE